MAKSMIMINVILLLVKCNVCKRNASKNRTIENGVCNECTINNDAAQESDVPNYDGAPCNPEDTLGNIKFKDFAQWMHLFIKEQIVNELKSYKKALDDVTKKYTEVRKELGTANVEIQDLKKKVADIVKERGDDVKITNDNLRYLINLDRNTRQRNVLLFGVPEDELQIGDKLCNSDEEVVNYIIELFELEHQVTFIEAFRLGKNTASPSDVTDGRKRSRPIKIIFETSSMARKVTDSSPKLKELFKDNDTNIYMKPDKTKSERDEYTRLGKRKAELLNQHPTVDGQPPRVVLKSGKLLVDNTQVDYYRTPATLF